MHACMRMYAYVYVCVCVSVDMYAFKICMYTLYVCIIGMHAVMHTHTSPMSGQLYVYM